MFVHVKNNTQDVTAVVAFAHIPPGQTWPIQQHTFSRWLKNGGQRLIDAGIVSEVKDEWAQAAPTTAERPESLPESVPEDAPKDDAPVPEPGVVENSTEEVSAEFDSQEEAPPGALRRKRRN